MGQNSLRGILVTQCKGNILGDEQRIEGMGFPYPQLS